MSIQWGEAIMRRRKGQPWTPVLTLPHVHDGLRVLLMAVLCAFRRLSRCRPVHRQLTRNALHDLTTIVPATACHQRNYVETYSRSTGWTKNVLCRSLEKRSG